MLGPVCLSLSLDISELAGHRSEFDVRIIHASAEAIHCSLQVIHCSLQVIHCSLQVIQVSHDLL